MFRRLLNVRQNGSWRLGLVAILVSLFVFSGNVAAADPRPPTDTDSTTIVPMYFVPKGMDPQAFLESGAVPDGSTIGSCGTVSIDLRQPGGLGTARITLGVISTWGFMEIVDWKWTLYKQGLFGLYYPQTGDQGYNVPNSAFWSRAFERDISGPGKYKAVFESLTATMTDGRVCVGLKPEDVRDLV